MNYSELIADNLTKAGWRYGCISITDHQGRQFWVAAAQREDAGRFIVRGDEKLTAYRYFLLTNRNATARIRV